MNKSILVGSMLLTGSLCFANTTPANAAGGNPNTQPWNFFDSGFGNCTDSNTSLLGFSTYTDCVGQVTNPNNDVGNNNSISKPTLLTFLNNELEDPNSSGVFDPFNWLSGKTWLSAGDEIQNGTGVNGLFSSSLNNGSAKTGTWTFDLGNANQTVEGLVISVKAATGYSAYFFDTSTLTGPISGNWDTLGLKNNGGNQPDISHISAYYVRGNDRAVEPEPVPEPAAMVGLMAVGVGIVLNRRKKVQ